MLFQPGQPVVRLLLLVALLTLPGCIFRDLSRNLDQISRAGRISFNVEGERFGDHPVIAALIHDDQAMVTVETYGVVPDTNQLTFYCAPGEYLLAVFQDINGNYRYDPAEPFATYGQPTPLEVWDGREIDGLTLTLAVPVDPDAWSPTKLRERGVEVSPRLADFGQVLSLDDPRFERDVARLGMWEPARFIAENHAGLFLLEAYDPEKIPIVFVHGIGGTPRHFRQIIESLDPEQFQAWIFYYPSALRLPLLGDYLQLSIERLVAAHRPERMFVVAHSMGGLVAWAGVRAHLRDVAEPYVNLLVTINSPLGGMKSASAGVDYAPVVMPSWIDLDPRSEFLSEVYVASLPDSLPYFLFYGIGENKQFPLPLPLDMVLRGDIVLDGEDLNDQTVDLDSQLHRPAAEHAQEIFGYRDTHMGILENAEMIAELNLVLATRARQAVDDE